MVDILDHENVTDVVAVGHDWGSKTVSVLGNLYQDRFLGFGFLAVGYQPPRWIEGNITQLRDQAIANFGYEIFGYWEFFSAPDGPAVMANHTESFNDVFYPKDGRIWLFNQGPQGAIRIFLESDSRTPRVQGITKEQWAYRNKVFGKYGYEGPVNYYKTNLNGETTEDDKKIPLDKYMIEKPVLFIGAHRDIICVDWFHEQTTRKYCPKTTYVNLDTTHWVAAEAADKVNDALGKWIEGEVLA
ncbi:hypothetical protein NMY22_g12375 [Coprinellus aureogranulatus]|nr:hypothetical protein NMY22_g12375 [Coprinellus aureogranulatus]